MSSNNDTKPFQDEHKVLVYAKWQLDEFARNPYAAPGVLKELDPQVLDRLDRLFYTSPIIQTVYQIITDALLAGGILFQENGTFLAEDVNRALQDIWSQWIRGLVASLYTYGFALCVIEPHAQFKGIPRMLSIRDLRILMHRNVYEEYFFASYPRDDNITQGGVANSVFANAMAVAGGPGANAKSAGQIFGGHGGFGVPIEGVIAFTDDRYAPTSSGELRSKLLSIIPVMDRFEEIERHNAEAIRLAANPFLAVETKEAPIDPRNSQFVGARQQESIGAAKDPNAVSTQQIPVSRIIDAVKQQRQPQPQQQEIQTTASGSSRVPLQTGLAVLRQTPHGFGIADLSTRQQAGTLITAQNVKELSDYRANYEETIGSLLGVPRSMFAQASRGKTSSNDEQNRAVFHENQRALKQKLYPFIQRMYTAIYFGDKDTNKKKQEETEKKDEQEDGVEPPQSSGSGSDRNVAEDNTDSENSSHEKQQKDRDTSAIAVSYTDNLGGFMPDAADRTETHAPEVSVYLPAIPSSERLDFLYQSGTLQYDAYKRIVSVDNGIPMAWLNDVPVMTLQELNGIKEQQGSTTTKSESKTSNSKTGAAKQKGQTVTKTAQPQTGVGSKYDQMQKKRNKPLSASKSAPRPGATLSKKKKKRQRVS